MQIFFQKIRKIFGQFDFFCIFALDFDFNGNENGKKLVKI